MSRVSKAMLLLVFIGLGVVEVRQAVALELPAPGVVVHPSSAYNPPVLLGISLHANDPLMIDFIVHPGDEELHDEQLQQESVKLIKYFMAALTVPEDEMWVNLSPYEKDRIIAEDFGKTEMGRDLLAQDYILKQLTASLMNPQDELGGEFWERVYQRAYEEYGTTDVPMNTFNKVWIVPDRAQIYQNGANVFVVDSRLRVLLDGDYLALEANAGSTKHGLGDVSREELTELSKVSAQVVREIILPEIEREVNEGRLFAPLRQIAHSVILANWYKANIRQGVLKQLYVNQNKTDGIALQDREANQRIYERYVTAFEEGVYNFIREEYDPATDEVIPRKYFSGGVNFDRAVLVQATDVLPTLLDRTQAIRIRLTDGTEVSTDDLVRYAEAFGLPITVDSAPELARQIQTNTLRRLAVDFDESKGRDVFFPAHTPGTAWLQPDIEDFRLIQQRLRTLLLTDSSTYDAFTEAFRSNNTDQTPYEFFISQVAEYNQGTRDGLRLSQELLSMDDLDSRPTFVAIISALLFQADGQLRDIEDVRAGAIFYTDIGNENVLISAQTAISQDLFTEILGEMNTSLVAYTPERGVEILVEAVDRLRLAEQNLFNFLGGRPELQEALIGGVGQTLENFITQETGPVGQQVRQSAAVSEQLRTFLDVLDAQLSRVRAAQSASNTSSGVRDNSILPQDNETVGGIDFNPEIMKIETMQTGESFDFEFTSPQILNTQVNGLVPIIINVSPVTNIPLLLGEADKNKEQLTLNK